MVTKYTIVFYNQQLEVIKTFVKVLPNKEMATKVANALLAGIKNAARYKIFC